MVSICLLTYNGATYIEQQIRSILCQIGPDDEITVSDDGSIDDTLSIINSLNDSRIKIFNHPKIENRFENKVFRNAWAISSNCSFALSHASGDVIFLSDQDDVWRNNKVEIMCKNLQDFDLAIHNCAIIDGHNNVIANDYFDITPPRLSFLGLLRKSSYMGCCMAFKRKILELSLPFPPFFVEHDAWIGVQALKHGKVVIVPEVLMDYRRHGVNISPCGEQSPNPLWVKLVRRICLFRIYLYRK